MENIFFKRKMNGKIRGIGLSTILVWISLSISTCSSGPKTLVILHSNDIHGTFQPQSIRVKGSIRRIGGMEAASHYINQIRSQEKNVILIDTGDLMTGSLAAMIEFNGVSGGAMPEFLNRLGYDLRIHGNHAFDLGFENAMKLEKLTDFPMIMANLVYLADGRLFAKEPYHIFNKGGMKIAVIAVMEENFLTEVSREKVQTLNVLPMVSTLESYLPELDRRSDLIIAIIHAKFDIAAQVVRESGGGMDVALVASSDGRFEMISGVMVKSTLGRQKTLGRIRVEVKDDRIVDFTQDLVWLWADEEINPSPEVAELVAEVEKSIESEYAKIIGKSELDYQCPGYSSIENSLGNWITDVMRWKTGTQIAMQNSGGIRSDIFAGPISKRDIIKLSPFKNTLIQFELNGSQLKQILETDIERDRDRLQFSGLQYSYYPKHARPFGERVDRIEVEGELIVDDGRLVEEFRTFLAVGNDYLVGQAKNKYFGFEIESFQETDFSLHLVLIEWLEKKQILTCSLEDRIIELSPEKKINGSIN